MSDAAGTPETLRPTFHVTTSSGWLNDPLGLTFHGGRYHLFYQHVPDVPEWDLACRWGHATSPDLLGWTEHPVALAPGDGDGGCWSGCVVVPAGGGPALLFYTSVNLPDLDAGRVRVARARDDSWLGWDKGEVVAAPPDPGLVMFRDPVVVPEAGGWLMVVGGALGGGTAAALAFTSDDLASWHYAGPLATRSGAETEGTWTGAGWECPQLLRVDGHDLLVVSVWEPARLHDVAVGVGTREGGRFAAAAWQQLTVGGGHYAASAFTDREGRAGLVFWVRGVGDPTSGWMGALSVPYLVGVEDGRVRLRPHPNLEALRREPGPGPHAALDAEWTPDPAAAGPVLELVTENEGAAVRLTAGEGWIEMTAGASAPVRLERTSGRVRILLDGPMIEVCTDRQLAGAAVPPFPGGLVPRLAGGALQWWALAATDAELAGA
jgi:beta-fructofuranosidase